MRVDDDPKIETQCFLNKETGHSDIHSSKKGRWKEADVESFGKQTNFHIHMSDFRLPILIRSWQPFVSARPPPAVHFYGN